MNDYPANKVILTLLVTMLVDVSVNDFLKNNKAVILLYLVEKHMAYI